MQYVITVKYHIILLRKYYILHSSSECREMVAQNLLSYLPYSINIFHMSEAIFLHIHSFKLLPPPSHIANSTIDNTCSSYIWETIQFLRWLFLSSLFSVCSRCRRHRTVSSPWPSSPSTGLGSWDRPA